MGNLIELIGKLADMVWGVPLLVMLLFTHLFLTIRLRFIQRHIGRAIKLSVTKDEIAQGDVSQFSALATSLAATIGTGNIVGVATAVAIGGPGAVFWAWLTGVFGIATKYGEALLAVKYRIKTSDGTMAGGPMYVLEHGLKEKYGLKKTGKFLGILFALFTALAALGIGCMAQANSATGMINDVFGIDSRIIGLILAALVGIVIIGGIKNIAKVCDKLVPFMAVFYIIGCIIILALSYKTIPATISLIIKSAFTGQAATGGFAGATVMIAARYGVARGLFSNESGLGSAPIVSAAAQTRNPVRQALVASTGTFWDTVIVCAITGIVLVNTGVWNKGFSGGELTNAAFGSFGMVGKVILTVALITFVFSTILGWSYYADKAIEYLAGKKVAFVYKLFFIAFVYFGSIWSLDVVWKLSDIANGLMAVPNLISLLLLSGVIVSETKKYLWEDNLDAVSEGYIKVNEK